MPRNSSYEDILDAAENTVMETGANHMTLEAVAKRTGISKGGLLYHFPSKDMLLQAMLERLIDRLDKAREAEDVGNYPGHELHAYIRSFSHMPERDERLMAALLAAAAHNPKLLAPACQAHRELFMQLSGTSPISPKLTAIIMASLQGFKLLKLLGVPFWEEAEFKASLEELLRMSGAPDEQH